MASDTAPAAAPDAADTTNQPATGRFAGALTALIEPVQPARPHDLGLTDPADETTGVATPETAPGSSADYHHMDPAQAGDGASKDSKSNTQQGVMRAWLLAGAERWRKGADARNKRLDVEKARAGAMQVKESRTLNRSEKFANQPSGSGSSAANRQAKPNKPASKSSSTGAGKGGPGGAKNTQRGGGSSGPGRSGGSGASGGSGSGGAGRGGRDTKNTPRKNNPSNGSAGSGTGKGAGNHNSPSKKEKQGAGSGAGKGGDSKFSRSGNRSGTGINKKSPSAKDKLQTTTSCGDASGISTTKKDKPSRNKDAARGTGKTLRPSGSTLFGKKAPKTGDTGKGADAAKKTDDPKDSKGREQAGNDKNNGKVDLRKKTAPDTKPNAATPQTKRPRGPRVNTRESREAGYLDGTRAAKVVAHVEAWRDGAKDGWTDAKEAAARDKARLDKAHADYKGSTAPDTRERPVSATTVTPIEVTSTDAKNVHFGAGAARSSASRGEVRNFVALIARLEAKTSTMAKIADETRGLAAEAQDQASECLNLLEQAKSVKGGDKVVGTLTSLADNAKSQVAKAADVHKRALRAADSCKSLLANVRTRYEPVFKAVVDSPETRPAELKFYADHGYAPAHAA